MYEELKKKQVIVDFEDFIKNYDLYNEDISGYLEFMKERFLNLSGVN